MLIPFDNISDVPETTDLDNSENFSLTVYDSRGEVETTSTGEISVAGIVYRIDKGGVLILPPAASKLIDMATSIKCGVALKTVTEMIEAGDVGDAADLLLSVQSMIKVQVYISVVEDLLASGLRRRTKNIMKQLVDSDNQDLIKEVLERLSGKTDN